MAKPKFDLIIRNYCRVNSLQLIPEFQFRLSRRWRSDYFIPRFNVLIEYEGMGRGSFGSMGGHQTIDGYTNNCEKYNAASLDGYKLLRYTAKNYGSVLVDLQKLVSL
jgi:hypothetical protein